MINSLLTGQTPALLYWPCAILLSLELIYVLSFSAKCRRAEVEKEGSVDFGNAIQDFDLKFQCFSLNNSVIWGFYVLKMDVNSQKGITLKYSCWLVGLSIADRPRVTVFYYSD